MDIDQISQFLTNTLSPLILPRWISFFAIAAIFIYRICIKKSHWVIAYVSVIYLLHTFILFATPKDSSIPDPFEAEEEDQENYNPRNIDNEFRPYVRKLPEFQFWKMCLHIIIVSHFLICFSFTDLPAEPAILVIYSVIIFCITAFRLLAHSKKYKYNLFFSSKNSLAQ